MKNVSITITDFVAVLETRGDYSLSVRGQDGAYQFKIFQNSTRQYVYTSKIYNTESGALRQGRKKLKTYPIEG